MRGRVRRVLPDGWGIVPFLLLSLVLHGCFLVLASPGGRALSAGEWPELVVVSLGEQGAAQPMGHPVQHPIGAVGSRLPHVTAAVPGETVSSAPAVQPALPVIPHRVGVREQVLERPAAPGVVNEGMGLGHGAGAAVSGSSSAPAGEGGGLAVLGSAGAPAFLRRAVPVYPPSARRFSREGQVLLRLSIDDSGRLLKVSVLEGAGFGFTESAVSAIERSTYKPAERNGRVVKADALVRVVYSLRDP